MIAQIRELLSDTNKHLIYLTVIAGIGAGIASLLFIMLINHTHQIVAIQGHGIYILLLVLCILFYLGINYLSFGASARLTNEIVRALRLRLQRDIFAHDYYHLQVVGEEALYSINNDDMEKVQQFAMLLPRLIINIFMISIVIVYMLILSWRETGIFLLLMFIGMSLSYGFQHYVKRHYANTREAFDQVTGNFQDLVKGLRELKVSRLKRQLFYQEDSLPLLSYYHECQTRTWKYNQALITWFWLVMYTTIAALVYFLNSQTHPHPFHLIMPLLMLFAPLNFLIISTSTLFAAYTALDKIALITTKEPIADAHSKPPLSSFTSIELDTVVYYYSQGQTTEFKSPCFDFEITPGKVIFITGQNGCGKSTLIKLITGLYLPTDGEIRLDGKAIKITEHYQSLFSVIYQAPHIFRRALVPDFEEKLPLFHSYLAQFELQDKLQVEAGNLIKSDHLSYGQKKRLGLILALLEDRPIYIFDEWAADQDPRFREIFYTQIIADLKKRGKAIVVVSHDDVYFSIADQLLDLSKNKNKKVIKPSDET
ncbi:MAG: cyclic peptide export ABC transporter [Pseudomonadota bacterium]